ncbi:MAG: ribosome biogenesis GTP-binding protein YihA/YsxC [Pigmentiphaga sp.]|nr:ribosome biogenesis GTP-binding protein YihA/YsxC [Pigmentiphaga sp.]
MSLLHRARFHTSAAKLEQLPPPGPAEVAFVGRSNSGKSSAINVLAGQRRLAFSSRTPGRTRLINLFGLPDPLEPESDIGYLVDLPGYGYAAVPQSARLDWADVLGRYLRERTSLAGLVLLLDIRRGLTEHDQRLVDWVAPAERPVLVLLTKADKLPYGQRVKAVAAIRRQLAELGTLEVIPFSATQRIGLDEAANHIERWILPQVAP